MLDIPSSPIKSMAKDERQSAEAQMTKTNDDDHAWPEDLEVF